MSKISIDQYRLGPETSVSGDQAQASDAAEIFFRALFSRMPLSDPGVVELRGVSEVPEMGWLLHLLWFDGVEGFIMAAPGERACVMRSLNFSWISWADPWARSIREKERTATQIKQLASVDVEAAPLSLTGIPPKKPERQTTRFWLPGVCDRMCVFCPVGDSKRVFEGSGRDLRRLHPWSPHRLVLSGKQNLEEGVGRLTRFHLRWHKHRVERLACEAPDTRLVFCGLDVLRSPIFRALLEFAYDLGFRGMEVVGPEGMLEDSSLRQFLLSHDVRSLTLTCHGATRTTFDLITGVEGAHDRFWRIVDALVQDGFALSFEVPCHTRNVQELPATLDMLQSLPAGLSTFFWHTDESASWMQRSLPLEYSDSVRSLASAAELVPPGRVTTKGWPPCVAPLKLRQHFRWQYPGGHNQESTHVHVARCEGCDKRDICPGTSLAYETLFPFGDTPGWD